MSDKIKSRIQMQVEAEMKFQADKREGQSELSPARGSATGTATSENESMEAWILEAARELAMDSAHIQAIAGIIKRHAPKPNAAGEPQPPTTKKETNAN